MSNHESANQMRSRIQHEKERARDLRTSRRELTDSEAAELYDLEHDEDYEEDEETGASGGASAGAGTGVLFFNNEQEEEEQEESGDRFAQCLQEDEGPEADVEYITDLAMDDFKKAREAGFSEEEIEELRRWLRHLLSVKP
jgi:hypothetical protein